MSKIATKAIESMWCQARYAASSHNGRLGSREGAAEETGIERTRMARIELGSLVPYPEEVLLMADTYHAPELKNYYCRECCPLGKNVPKVDNESLDRITVRAMSSMNKISKAKDLLLEITEDGVVTDEERPDLQKIIDLLDELNGINQNLKLWLEKNREEGYGSRSD